VPQEEYADALQLVVALEQLLVAEQDKEEANLEISLLHTRVEEVWFVGVCVCVCVFVRVCEGLKNFWSTFPDLPDGVSNSCEITGLGRRCMGCVKSQVSFRTRATDYRAFLRKITYRDKVSYAS